MNKNRPVNLDLAHFHFPPMAILSICHRIAGVLLFLFLPLMIYLLHESLASPSGFVKVFTLLHNFWMELFVWIMLCAILFHLVAGIRHLAMDLGFGESLNGGRISAYVVFVFAIILFILAGVWVW
jgi:succinate dehydrogenase / fumarate reductase, cytochrome b subunit